MFKFFDHVAATLGMQYFSQTKPTINQSIVFMLPSRLQNVNSLVELPFVYGIYTQWVDHDESETGGDRVLGSKLPIQLLPSALKAKLERMRSRDVVLVNPLLEFLSDTEKGVVEVDSLEAAYWVDANHVLAVTNQTVAQEIGLQPPKVRSALLWNGNVFK